MLPAESRPRRQPGHARRWRYSTAQTPLPAISTSTKTQSGGSRPPSDRTQRHDKPAAAADRQHRPPHSPRLLPRHRDRQATRRRTRGAHRHRSGRRPPARPPPRRLRQGGLRLRRRRRQLVGHPTRPNHPPGLFGENLRTHDLDVSGAIIGEKWRIGTVLLEVRMPRTPCHNLSLRIGIDNFHIRFNTSGRVGAMLKVHEPGLVCAATPSPSWTAPTTACACATSPPGRTPPVCGGSSTPASPSPPPSEPKHTA